MSSEPIGHAVQIGREAGTVSAYQALPPKRERLLALDVFRGITLIGMVLVNNHGNPHFRYTTLNHASWHGWTFTDLVFPFFLFIVGAAIPFSIESRLARGASQKAVILNAFRRAVVLFAVGLAMNWYTKLSFSDWHTAVDFAHLRYFAVLQRIGVCFFLATLLYLWCGPRLQIAIGAVLLVFYFVLMKLVPVPGYGAGVLDQVGNWAQYIDERVMGAHCGSNFKGHFFEGKGLLSTLPALVTTMIGMGTGRYLRSTESALQKLVNLYFLGTLSMFLGSFWAQFFPINQNLWTSSLVLLMGGIAMVVLASCYYLADVRKSTWWTPPLLVFGMNSIAVWVGSTIFRQTLEKTKLVGSAGAPVDLKTSMFNWLASYLGPWNGSLAFAILYTLFWLGVLTILYRKRIFLKI